MDEVTIDPILKKVKGNLILQHDKDDELLEGFIAAAVSYAEAYQHKPEGFYIEQKNEMPPTTEQAVVMLASFFYESRDGSSGGFFPDRAYTGNTGRTWSAVNSLLRLRREVVL